MGVVAKPRKKYMSHKKRWVKKTIDDEKKLVTDYALKKKKEIRRVEFQLSKYKRLAKELNKMSGEEKDKEAEQLLNRLKSEGILSEDATTLDEVLDISVRDVLERRLSNIVYKHQLAKTPNQARQFVVHGHVKVGDSVITAPSYQVSLDEEKRVDFVHKSALSDETHPERNGQPEGLEQEIEQQEEIPINENEEISQDQKEQALEDEEVDEVKEE